MKLVDPLPLEMRSMLGIGLVLKKTRRTVVILWLNGPETSFLGHKECKVFSAPTRTIDLISKGSGMTY